MTQDPQAARHDRLRNALRENLKRRKAQAKGRAAGTESLANDTVDRDESADRAEQPDSKPSS